MRNGCSAYAEASSGARVHATRATGDRGEWSPPPERTDPAEEGQQGWHGRHALKEAYD